MPPSRRGDGEAACTSLAEGRHEGECLSLPAITGVWAQPRTEAVRRALLAAPDETAISDLLFLESWEVQAPPDIASTLRAGQIRRANPLLAEAIRAELRSTTAPRSVRTPPVSFRPQ
jgi:hypothetical protein